MRPRTYCCAVTEGRCSGAGSGGRDERWVASEEELRSTNEAGVGLAATEVPNLLRCRSRSSLNCLLVLGTRLPEYIEYPVLN